MDVTAVWIVVLHVGLLNYSGTVVADHSRHHVAFVNEADCRAHVRAVRRDVPIPSMVTLTFAGCRKMEIRK